MRRGGRARILTAATAASAVLALGAVGCGGGVQERGSPPVTSANGVTTTSEDEPTSTTGSIPLDSAGICDPLARIAAADRASTQATEGVTEWSDLQPLIVAGSVEAVGLYDEALEIAPDEIFDELLIVRDVTDEAGDLAAESASAEEFQAAGQEIDDFAEAQEAVTALNAFTQRVCGFTLADS